MAGDEQIATLFEAGELLMWRVKGDRHEDAEAWAQRMGAIADAHELGNWGVAPIGLGCCCWFDITLTKDVGAVFLCLVFDRPPDHRY